MELLEGMQGRGLAADIITCSAAISTCEKGKRPGKELPEDMQWRGLLPVTPACEWGVSAESAQVQTGLRRLNRPRFRPASGG